MLHPRNINSRGGKQPERKPLVARSSVESNVAMEARGNVVVKAQCYKPEGRGFETRRSEFLNLPNPSDCSRPWGLLSL
jgi:hypothetical protein